VIDPAGVYEINGLPIEVLPDGAQWKLVLAGVPEGFEPGLIRVDDSTFRVERGLMAGALLSFNGLRGGKVGPIPFARVEGLYRQLPGYGLKPPPFVPNHERYATFRGLLDRTEEGGRVDWDLPYPKHEFVRWAQQLDEFVIHSSTNREIEEFLPIRNSMELLDHGGRGNLGAVYATHDGYWSMFFGIVDRERLRGSLRNGVYVWQTPDGRTTTTYQFSLDQESLRKSPFTKGAVYLLPRSTFRRVPHYPGGPISDEWVSEQPVRPRALLLVEPDDFPFLDQIAGHDESEFLGMVDLFGEVVARATGFDLPESGGLAIDLAWSCEIDAMYTEWAALADQYMPVVTRHLEGEGDSRTLFLDGPGPYLERVRERLEEILSAPA
jgi:hypothetical protein